MHSAELFTKEDWSNLLGETLGLKWRPAVVADGTASLVQLVLRSLYSPINECLNSRQAASRKPQKV